MVDIAKGPAEVFPPLKAVLESISIVYTEYQVCFDAPFDVLLSRLRLQNTVAVRDKITILCSRIVALEKLFEQPASDEKETKLREELLRYASNARSEWVLKPSQQTQTH